MVHRRGPQPGLRNGLSAISARPGTEPHPGPGRRGRRTISTQDLKGTVILALEDAPDLDAAHFGVTAEGGIVTLTGHVATPAEKRAAEDAARATRWRRCTGPPQFRTRICA